MQYTPVPTGEVNIKKTVELTEIVGVVQVARRRDQFWQKINARHSISTTSIYADSLNKDGMIMNGTHTVDLITAAVMQDAMDVGGQIVASSCSLGISTKDAMEID
ncbi:hypothetical protein VNI00_015410 [Paramarasmius palmivorus]|uniref:Uncharacterized protein n=1 Tax=Paramarasmius palmivorus TaxID=297713 RepID=A0AAW0BK24_9AGAR